MKVLFVMRSAGFLRNFENVLVELLRRGHDISVAIEQEKLAGTYRVVMEGMRDRGARFVVPPVIRHDPDHRAATQLRLGLDYLHYLAPQYEGKDKLRARAAKAAPAPVVWASRLGRGRADGGPPILMRTLRALDAAAPGPAAVERFLIRERPDVLMVTPVVELGAPQTDWLRSARRLGIPTCHAVASWDNLTVKGHVREWPDMVAVWNEAQRSEAQELHGLPPERVLATGAHTYDHWFTWRPARSPAEFCREVGLRDDRPYVLYLCSSPFIAPGEAQYVREWIGALRRSADPVLREVGVLVRPHPQHAAQWEGVDLSDLGQAVVWPRGGADPVEARSRDDFFDSIHHCRAVAGVNTSALIESAIVGRPVLTVLDERYADTQSGTLHFDHLASGRSGILTVARDTAEHHRQLSMALAGELPGAAERREHFLRHFVRPHGLDRPAAPRLADELEALVARGPAPPPPVPAADAPAGRGARWLWSHAPVALLIDAASGRGSQALARVAGRAAAPLTGVKEPPTVAEALSTSPRPAQGLARRAAERVVALVGSDGH